MAKGISLEGSRRLSACTFCPHRARRLRWISVATLFVALGLVSAAFGEARAPLGDPEVSMDASGLLALKQRCESPEPVSDSLQLARKLAFGAPFDKGRIAAFEENRHFIYALAEASKPDGRGGDESQDPGQIQFVRRLVFLKPSTFVLDDLVCRLPSSREVRWLLQSQSAPEITNGRIRVPQSNGELLLETLLPANVTRESTGPSEAGRRAAALIKAGPQGGASNVRLLHVINTRRAGSEKSSVESKLVQEDGRLRLTVSTPDRVFQLTLPPASVDTGEIEVCDTGGKVLLDRRVLPSGVLPHGPEGVRLLERWDTAYRRDSPPGWDIGRPSSHLKKAVEDGTFRPGRAVVLGCGSGTNAIYLASQGFDVTGVDIAPTALSQCREKAKQAEVKVRWLLADVLAPPDLEPFDLVFDRGCYHGVRRQSAAGYVETLRRLSRPGTQVLIIAGNANEPEPRRGPPRVQEEEIRADFSSLFEFEWLRETQFDSRNPEEKGALAWSIRLRRKEEP